MDDNKIIKEPIVKHARFKIDEETEIGMLMVEYNNGIQFSIYEGPPNVGSYVAAFPVDNNIERNIIFSGRNQDITINIAQYLSHRSSKICYTSVYLEKESKINYSVIRPLLNQFLSSKESSPS